MFYLCSMKVAIIGAGAAGCFCAVNLKRMLPEADVTVFERSSRPLAKVAITGGGRCNITNTFRAITHLQQAYPRGWRLMERLFRRFGPEDTMRWWEAAGVPLVVQDDECVFPRSQDAMQVVRTLVGLMQESGVRLVTGCRIEALPEGFDFTVVTTGGSPRRSGLSFLSPLQVDIAEPMPSLFALNIDDPELNVLTGTVVEDCHVALSGTKFQADGPILITHFGMSGPAILRLSSYAACQLAAQDYRAEIRVNWMRGLNEEQVRAELQPYFASGKLLGKQHPPHLTSRHWAMLTQRAGLPDTIRWDKMNRREANRLTNTLTADTYHVSGRRTHKAEFVTCGGVALSNLQGQSLSLKSRPDVFLAGEVLDVDGITGGFNLQAAWTMGYVVAQNIAGLAR